MSSTSPPAYSTLAAYRLPGNWFRILTSARTSPIRRGCTAQATYRPSNAQQEDIAYCLRVLHDYHGTLTKWRTEFAPRSPEEALDERFVEALHMLDVVDDLMDRLAFGPTSQKVTTAKRLLDGQLLPRMEARLDTLKAKETA